MEAKNHDFFDASDLVKAIETSFVRSWMPFGRLPGAILHDGLDMIWFTTGIQESLLNAVLCTQIEPSEIDARLSSMISSFHKRNLPVSWYVGPSTRPQNLGNLLMSYGFTLADVSSGMAVDLVHLPNKSIDVPGLVIKQADTVESMKTWIEIFKEGFDMSGDFIDAYTHVFATPTDLEIVDYHYLGTLDGHPIASLTLSFDQGIANIYDVATIPTFRRRGIATAMLLTALLDARTSGYRIGVLQATKSGIKVYRRVGFLDYCTFERYIFDS